MYGKVNYLFSMLCEKQVAPLVHGALQTRSCYKYFFVYEITGNIFYGTLQQVRIEFIMVMRMRNMQFN